MGKPNKNTQSKADRTPEENEAAHATGIPIPEDSETPPNLVVVMREREYLCDPENVEEAMIEAARKNGVELVPFDHEADKALAKAEGITKEITKEVEAAAKLVGDSQKALEEAQKDLEKAQADINGSEEPKKFEYTVTLKQVVWAFLGVGAVAGAGYGAKKVLSNRGGSPEMPESPEA